MKTRSTALSRSLELLVTVAAPLAGIAGIAAQKQIPVGATSTVLAAVAAGVGVPIAARFLINPLLKVCGVPLHSLTGEVLTSVINLAIGVLAAMWMLS